MTVILHLPVLKYDFDFDMWYDVGEDDDDAAANDDDVIVISGRRADIWLSSTLSPTDKKLFPKTYLLNSRKHNFQVI